MSESSCLVCGSGATHQMQRWSADELTQQWQAVYNVDACVEFVGVPSVSLIRCQNCGLKWFDPPVAGSASLYAQLERFDWYYQSYKWEHGQALRDLAGSKRMLEVGCGFGAFLKLAEERLGILAEGIELNESAIKTAIAAGCTAYLRDVNEVDEQYDAVCAFQVLEHVPDPGPFLEACCRVLRPGGKLLVAVPNADSFLRHGMCLLDMPPHHVTRWSRATLRGLTDRLPLCEARVRVEPLATYHVQDYVKSQWRAWAGRRFGEPRALHLLGDALRRSGAHRWLTGHTLYACFTRNSAS